MTREEILAIAKPILFNTEMVQAILANYESVTRRVVRPQPGVDGLKYCFASSRKSNIGKWRGVGRNWNPPCRPGDILYVRETWTIWDGDYEYKADVDDGYGPFCSNCTLDICTGGCNSVLKWRPSIHMPKEAARIFLRVTNVRVERLQDITEEQAKLEGAIDNRDFIHSPDNEYTILHSAKEHYAEIWDSTIKKADLSIYGWDANPWVWVIEFERVEAEK